LPLTPAASDRSRQSAGLRVDARSLVEHHDAATREVRFNERLHAFADYWDFRPRACAPYRARTKGKDERGVGYVKRNAVAGHAFISWAAFEAHLERWLREIADLRVHGTTGEAPLVRFQREEAAALKAIDGRPPFRQVRDLVRRVQADCAIEQSHSVTQGGWSRVWLSLTAAPERETRRSTRRCESLQKGSAGPTCPAEEDASVTVHGETLISTSSVIRNFAHLFYPGPDGSFGETYIVGGGVIVHFDGRVIGEVLDADFTDHAADPLCEYHWHLARVSKGR
jgi:hypothetical protein